MMLKIFFDISTGFRFSKISVECSVHLYSCPWVMHHISETQSQLNKNLTCFCVPKKLTCQQLIKYFTWLANNHSLFFLSYFQMLAAWVYGWIEDDLLISSIFALDVCGIRSPNAVWKVDGKIVFSLKIINFSNNFHLRWSWKLTDKFLIG